jgi:hypothetical protein
MHPGPAAARRAVAAVGALLASAWVALGAAAPAGAQAATEVRDGPARFQVLSPTLIRLEYAADGRFEDRPTVTAISRGQSTGKVRTSVKDGFRVIRTSRVTLRYRIDSGPFDAANVSLKLRGQKPVAPLAPAPGNLGGWYRGLDGQHGPIGLHDGLLAKGGWYVLDDTGSAILTEGGSWYEPRAPHEGPYSDQYLFAYGREYERALGDLRHLTGPAPLPPRQAFGNWFSRYFGYSTRAYQRMLKRFRADQIPLDVLIVDTDFKSPNPWNGWQWTPVFFPEPAGFLEWAHSQDLDVGLNVHPSISVEDPGFAQADEIAGGLPWSVARCQEFTQGRAPVCGVWDWAQRDHVRSYFSLHEPFEAVGADFWWLDWCCDESNAVAPGLTPDTWINGLYAQRARARGSRWPTLARIGSSMWDYGAAMPGVWAEHRSAIHFTGDTGSTWEMLRFQSRFTAAEGAGIGMPYVSHDIGGFFGEELRPDMYVRWVQFGAFQPILRLHSNHGRRLPWEYPKPARQIASGFMRLRGSMIPYLYTLARQAFDTGVPLARPMYLEWPRMSAAYRADDQYMLGDSLLVAPVSKPGRVVSRSVWLPPGEWIDIFTGERLRGGGHRRVRAPLERLPVFARAGSIVPRQPYSGQRGRAQARELTLDVYPGAGGSFTLYEDEGDGYAYEGGAFARTALRWSESANTARLSIGRTRGDYAGAIKSRGYELRIATPRRPAEVKLSIRGRTRELRRWSVDREAGRLVIPLGRISTKRAAEVRIVFSR